MLQEGSHIALDSTEGVKVTTYYLRQDCGVRGSRPEEQRGLVRSPEEVPSHGRVDAIMCLSTPLQGGYSEWGLRGSSFFVRER